MQFHLRPSWIVVGVLSLLNLVTTSRARAGDWPQILGVHRNSQADGEQLPDRWPAGGPKSAWSFEVGEGYAGPAVQGNRVIAFHRKGAKEIVHALEAGSGNVVWEKEFDATYPGGVNEDRGPRCVPTIAENRVIVFGAAGDLHCLDWNTGAEIWSRALYREMAGDLGYFGAGSCPLVVGGIVIVNVGGRTTGIVGLSLGNGETIWESTKEAASYAAPIAITLAGKPMVVCVTRMKTLVLNPQDGSIRSQVDFGKKGPTVNAATPLVFENRLFLTASYGIGARLYQFEKDSLNLAWSNDTSMSSQYATSVYHEGCLYGIHGREDAADAHLRCIDAKNGKVLWSEDNFGVAHLILAGDKMLILKTKGELQLARANCKKYEPLDSLQIGHMTRALPAFSNGRFFLRTNKGQNSELIALEVQ